MSYKVEIRAVGERSFASNAIRLPNEQQAQWYASNLWSRWMQAEEVRVVESSDDVNHTADQYGRLTQYNPPLSTDDLCVRVMRNDAEDIDSNVAEQIRRRLTALVHLIAEVNYINETVTDGDDQTFAIQVMQAIGKAEKVVNFNSPLPEEWS